MTQSDANHSPRQIPISRVNTGNFRDFSAVRGLDLQPKSAVFSGVLVGIPYSSEQGILKREQGINALEQRIPFEQ